MPLGSVEPVVMVSPAGATVTEKAAETDAPDVSVTWPVKAKVAAALGVPERVPELLSESPLGRAPVVTAKVKGGTPPFTASCWVGYGTPNMPKGSVTVVT